jgi:UDP-N-acetylmuramate dehydrogenase
MLLVEGDPDCRSAGSFFKNPVIGEEQLQRINAAVLKPPPRFPAGPEPENIGRVKIPAAWLIEQAGYAKGYRLGAAALSSRHTLALVNLGGSAGPGDSGTDGPIERRGASAAEVLALANKITAAVEARFGLRLEMEPVMVGF